MITISRNNSATTVFDFTVPVLTTNFVFNIYGNGINKIFKVEDNLPYTDSDLWGFDIIVGEFEYLYNGYINIPDGQYTIDVYQQEHSFLPVDNVSLQENIINKIYTNDLTIN